MEECDVCNGSGAVITFNTKNDRDEVQRCDHCMKYKTDGDAWNAIRPESDYFKGGD